MFARRRSSLSLHKLSSSIIAFLTCCLVIGNVSSMSLDRLGRQYQQQNDKQLEFSELMLPEAESEVLQNNMALVPANADNSDMYLLVQAADGSASADQNLQSLHEPNESPSSGNIESNSDMLMLESEDAPAIQVLELPADELETNISENIASDKGLDQEPTLNNESVSHSMFSAISEVVEEIKNKIQTELNGSVDEHKTKDTMNTENVKKEEEIMSIDPLPLGHEDTETHNTDMKQVQDFDMEHTSENIQNSEEETIGVVMEESNESSAPTQDADTYKEIEKVDEPIELDMQAEESEMQADVKPEEEMVKISENKIEEVQGNNNSPAQTFTDTIDKMEGQSIVSETLNNEIEIAESEQPKTEMTNEKEQIKEEFQGDNNFQDAIQEEIFLEDKIHSGEKTQANEEAQGKDEVSIFEHSTDGQEVKDGEEVPVLGTGDDTAAKKDKLHIGEAQGAEQIKIDDSHFAESQDDEIQVLEKELQTENNQAEEHTADYETHVEDKSEEYNPEATVSSTQLPEESHNSEEHIVAEESQAAAEILHSDESASDGSIMEKEIAIEAQLANEVQHFEPEEIKLTSETDAPVESDKTEKEMIPMEAVHISEENQSLANEAEEQDEEEQNVNVEHLFEKEQLNEAGRPVEESQQSEKEQDNSEVQKIEDNVKDNQNTDTVIQPQLVEDAQSFDEAQFIKESVEEASSMEHAEMIPQAANIEPAQLVEEAQTTEEIQYEKEPPHVEQLATAEKEAIFEENQHKEESQSVGESEVIEEVQRVEGPLTIDEVVQPVEVNQLSNEDHSDEDSKVVEKPQSGEDAKPTEEIQAVEEIENIHDVPTADDFKIEVEAIAHDHNLDEANKIQHNENESEAQPNETIFEAHKPFEDLPMPVEIPLSVVEVEPIVTSIKPEDINKDTTTAEETQTLLEFHENKTDEHLVKPAEILTDKLDAEKSENQDIQLNTSIKPDNENQNEGLQETAAEIQKPLQDKESDNILNNDTNESKPITEATSILTTIVPVPTKEQLAQQHQEVEHEHLQEHEHEQTQQHSAVDEIVSSTTLKPTNVLDSVLNYVNASFVNQINGDKINEFKQEDKKEEEQISSSQLRQYDGAQVWRIVVQNQKEKRLADELQTKYDGQLWKEVKQEVDYLLKPQVLVDAERHIRAANLSRIVLIENLQKAIEVENPPAEEIAQLQNRKGHRLTWQAYHRLEDIHGYFDYLAKTYPDICSVETIGYSIEKRHLKILKISNGNADNPGIWIDGGMHAREWISPAVVTYMANQIVEGWDDLPVYMRNINWYIHAVANPDGYEYSHTTDRLWRKNMRSHGRFCPGVDLNRNFGYKWGGKGTSANPCSQTYRGSKAFSEPETFYISKFISNFPRETFKAYLSFHSYGQYILYPWGYDNQFTRDMNDLDLVARRAGTIITKGSGVKYTVGSSASTLYPAAGGSDDWAKGIADIKYSYTIEMGDTGRYGFVLPAEYIEPNGKNGLIFVDTIAKAINMGKNARRRKLKAHKTH